MHMAKAALSGAGSNYHSNDSRSKSNKPEGRNLPSSSHKRSVSANSLVMARYKNSVNEMSGSFIIQTTKGLITEQKT